MYVYNSREVKHKELSFMEEQKKNTVNSELTQNPAVTILAIISFS